MQRVINIQPGEEVVIRCAARNNNNRGAPGPLAPPENEGNNLQELPQEGNNAPHNENEEVFEQLPNGRMRRVVPRGGKKTRKANKTRKNRKENGNENGQEGGGKKRKQSGFMRYSAEMRKTIGAEDPKMRSDVVAMAREIGKRWRALSDAEKAKY